MFIDVHILCVFFVESQNPNKEVDDLYMNIIGLNLIDLSLHMKLIETI